MLSLLLGFCKFEFYGSSYFFFSFGGHLLVVNVVKKPGDIFIAVWSIILGAYYLGLISPHLLVSLRSFCKILSFQVLLNARISAATIYQTIDRVRNQFSCAVARIFRFPISIHTHLWVRRSTTAKVVWSSRTFISDTRQEKM